MTTLDRRIEKLEASRPQARQVGMVEFVAWYRRTYGDRRREVEEINPEELEAVALAWAEYCEVNGLSCSDWLN